MIDLKQLMEDRSAKPPVLADVRYPQIRHRIAVRKRRRIALLATAVAVIVAIAGGYAALPHPRVLPDPVATSSPTKPSDGFAPYQFGRKMVHSVVAPVSQRQVTITWTPTRLDFHIAMRCSGLPERIYLRGMMYVNGNPYNEYLCGARSSDETARSEDWKRSGWIRDGEAIVLTYTVDKATMSVDRGETPAPVPGDGTIAVAIYAPVPFAEYEFPPRPAKLKPLADWSRCPPDHFLVGDPRDPLRPLSVTTRWEGVLMFRWDTQTPGSLRIAVDGLEIATLGWWDYGGLNWYRQWDTASQYEWAGIQGWKWPAQGAQVTFTFTPEHFTGGWQAALQHLDSDDQYRPCP